MEKDQYYKIKYIKNGETKYVCRRGHDIFLYHSEYFGILHLTIDCFENKYLLYILDALNKEYGDYELEKCSDLDIYRYDCWFTGDRFNKIWKEGVESK